MKLLLKPQNTKYVTVIGNEVLYDDGLSAMSMICSFACLSQEIHVQTLL